MDQEVNEVRINGIDYVRKNSVKPVEPEPIGDYVIVRTKSAGVFAGYIKSRRDCEHGNGLEVVMINARRIWFWAGAASLSQLAMDGTSKPESCKFPKAVTETTLPQTIEITPCTKRAKESILGVPIWQE